MAIFFETITFVNLHPPNLNIFFFFFLSFVSSLLTLRSRSSQIRDRGEQEVLYILEYAASEDRAASSGMEEGRGVPASPHADQNRRDQSIDPDQHPNLETSLENDLQQDATTDDRGGQERKTAVSSSETSST